MRKLSDEIIKNISSDYKTKTYNTLALENNISIRTVLKYTKKFGSKKRTCKDILTKEYIKEKLKEGLTIKQLANYHNIGLSGFYTKLAKADIKINSLKSEIIKEFFLLGLTNDEISQKLNIHLQTSKKHKNQIINNIRIIIIK